MKLWKRNAVVAAIVLFVCVAVYLNWSYQRENDEARSDRVLGQASLVSGTADPILILSDQASQTAMAGESAVPGETDGTGESARPTTGYFASARLNRQQARDSAMAMLKETWNDQDLDAMAREEAGAAIETLAASTLSEAQIENLVIAKGYQDCVAFISEGGVSVVVSALEEGLQDADVARITEIVTGETGVPASQVKIIEAQA